MGRRQQQSRFILYHDSVSKTIWNWLIVLATIYVAVTVPYNISFTSYQDNTVCDIVVYILFVIDIVLNFRTTYLDRSGRVVREARTIGMRYATTWFFVDLMAAFPFGLLHALNITVNPVIYLLKTVRILRLLSLDQKLDHYFPYSVAMLVLLLPSSLVAHWLACIWYVIGHKELEAYETWARGWLYILGGHLDTLYTNSTVGGPTAFSSYIAALCFTVTRLTNADFSANTDAEKLFSSCTMIIGGFLYIWVFANVATIIQFMSRRRPV